jgi:hypothetical protein
MKERTQEIKLDNLIGKNIQGECLEDIQPLNYVSWVIDNVNQALGSLSVETL